MGFKLSKVTKNKENMSFGFKHDLFSFALVILCAFHAENTAFSKCFPKKGKEQIIVLPPTFFTFLEVGYMPICP